MNDEYESKRQMFHHYVGHYLMGLESSLQEGGVHEVQERKQRVVLQLKGMGNFDLTTRCLALIESSNFSTQEEIEKFRKEYYTLDPKLQEFEELVARLQAERTKSGF